MFRPRPAAQKKQGRAESLSEFDSHVHRGGGRVAHCVPWTGTEKRCRPAAVVFFGGLPSGKLTVCKLENGHL